MSMEDSLRSYVGRRVKVFFDFPDAGFVGWMEGKLRSTAVGGFALREPGRSFAFGLRAVRTVQISRDGAGEFLLVEMSEGAAPKGQLSSPDP